MSAYSNKFIITEIMKAKEKKLSPLLGANKKIELGYTTSIVYKSGSGKTGIIRASILNINGIPRPPTTANSAINFSLLIEKLIQIAAADC